MQLHQATAFFVARAKSNFRYKRRYSRPIDKTTGLRGGQTGVLTGVRSKKDCPETMRRVVYRDTETGKRFVYLTNNFTLPALPIAPLYQARWQVELFFKWIKQHLRIKAFYGASQNAVKTQIWIAACVYALVAIVKKRLGLEHSLYTILQILSVGLFEKTPVLQAFSSHGTTNETDGSCNQLELFNF